MLPPLFPSHSSSISSPTCRRRLTLVSLLLCRLLAHTLRTQQISFARVNMTAPPYT